MMLRYSQRAQSDLESIILYLNGRSPSGARHGYDRLMGAFNGLLEMPFAGMETDISGVRVLFVGRYPYKIFYRVSGSFIDILHIRHTSRRPTQFG